MFLTLVLIMSTTCPKTQIKNDTDVWNEQDQQTLTKATKRCGELYSDAPCLKLFTKRDENTYRALCGTTDKKSQK